MQTINEHSVIGIMDNIPNLRPKTQLGTHFVPFVVSFCYIVAGSIHYSLCLSVLQKFLCIWVVMCPPPLVLTCKDFLIAWILTQTCAKKELYTRQCNEKANKLQK